MPFTDASVRVWRMEAGAAGQIRHLEAFRWHDLLPPHPHPPSRAASCPCCCLAPAVGLNLAACDCPAADADARKTIAAEMMQA